ncbi:MAG: hypothetical protein ACE14W_00570 [Candidatus Velamenicoccus archaeovorus]
MRRRRTAILAVVVLVGTGCGPGSGSPVSLPVAADRIAHGRRG